MRDASLEPAPGARALRVWRVVQGIVWTIGALILVLLVLRPAVGIHAFWNVLIPVAPALFAVAPGLWRNVCPLGSTALLARHVGLSRRGRLTEAWHGRLGLIGVLVLLVLVPLRHVVLDTSGPATAVTIAALAAVSVLCGLLFEWKSGWCSGLCPVHPVEQLYGSKPLLSVPNMHCTACERCVAPCPDSTPGLDPLVGGAGGARQLAGTVMVGGFVGFVWGWFQVPDYADGAGWAHLASAYGLPFGGLLTTLLVFLMLQQALGQRYQRQLVHAFAAAAIACYYWYRLPALFGFGLYPGDGMLIDLASTLPEWFPLASRVATTALCLWWLVGRSGQRRAWGIRPPLAA